MTIFEKIVRELVAAPEPLLLQVLDFIQSAQDSPMLAADPSNTPRMPGLHLGQVWMSEDFNEPLPDEFWLGDDA
jgi:hypothetical protein